MQILSPTTILPRLKVTLLSFSIKSVYHIYEFHLSEGFNYEFNWGFAHNYLKAN